uniref:Sigma-70 family RNA polymerase sigma factor n=1 Tax=Prevotella sp. GTC17254 TaxID=3236794 RepID=A0AB33J4E0_9BACT
MIQIDACKQGDPEALGELYTVYAHKLQSVCRHYIKDENAAEDILHDAFIIIFMSLKDLKDNDKLEGWMMTIVRNLSLRYLQSTEKRELSLSQLDIDIADNGPNEPRKNIELDVLLSAIEDLPPKNREVFKLSVLDGLTHKEIGKLLDIAPHSSSSQLFRAKKMLRTILIDYWAVLLLLPIFIPLYIYVVTRNKVEKVSKSSSPIVVHSRREDSGNLLSEERGKDTPSKVETTTSHVTQNDKCITLERTEVKYAKNDTTPTMKNMGVGTLTITPNTDSLQRNLAVDGSVEDSLFHLPQTPSDEFMAIDTHTRLNIEQKKKYPWTFNVGYSSNAGANGALSNLNYLSVIDYANGGAAAKLYTWSDLETYYARNNALMDSVERARMSLMLLDHPMDDNSPLGEVAHHYRPKTFGLSINKQLNPKWTFGTGVTYTRLKSEYESEYHKARLVKTQKIDYVGIPLRLTYRVLGKGRFNAYTTGGVTFEMPVRSSLAKKFIVTSDSTFTLKGDIKPRYQWSVNLGVGVQYKIFKPFCLYLESNMFYYFKNGSGLETYRTEHPFIITVPFGLRLTW